MASLFINLSYLELYIYAHALWNWWVEHSKRKRTFVIINQSISKTILSQNSTAVNGFNVGQRRPASPLRSQLDNLDCSLLDCNLLRQFESDCWKSEGQCGKTVPLRRVSRVMTLPRSTVSAPEALSWGDSYSTLPQGFSTVAQTTKIMRFTGEWSRWLAFLTEFTTNFFLL